MARTSRRARSQQRSNLLWASLALLLVISAIAATAWWWGHKANQELDAKTMCPASGPLGHNVLLIDKTDPLNMAQKAALDLYITDLAQKNTPQGYLLSVFMLSNDFKANTQALVELCNPGNGTGHSAVTENIKQLNRRYSDQFLKPVFEQTQLLTDIQPAKESPILEMLQMIGLNSLQKYDVQGEKTLVVVSDFLQNSPQLSMDQGTPNFQQFSQLPYATKTKINLKGVDVKLLVLYNTPHLQKPALYEFWKQYFKDAGAQSVQLDLLPG